MLNFNLTYKPFGDNSILIEWPSKIDDSIIKDIVSFEKLITKEQKVVETIIAYNSILVTFNNVLNYTFDYKYQNSYKNAISKLKELYKLKQEITVTKKKIWIIPVCYDVKFGLDLKEISEVKGISISDIIDLHSKPKYLIYFFGFQPGFMYLGGLDSKIHLPRKSKPRVRVIKGSVGIGVGQTGIYPQNSSGGWNIIGNSPINFFDVSKSQPCIAKAGEYIQFESIGLVKFYEIKREIENGTYQPKYLLDD